LRVPHDIDRTGVPAAGQHHQATSPYVHDKGLIVHDEGIVPPLRTGPRLMGSGHAPLEFSCSIDLSADQDAAVHEQ
jgi:hypothetical protein